MQKVLPKTRLTSHEKDWLPLLATGPLPHSQKQSAAGALLQLIDLALESEPLGMDGAYFPVHHFAQQLASSFPLLAVVGAMMRKIEVGTAVIDMLCENAHYIARTLALRISSLAVARSWESAGVLRRNQ